MRSTSGRAFGLALCLVLAASVSACAEGGSLPSGNGGAGGSGGGTTTSTTTSTTTTSTSSTSSSTTTTSTTSSSTTTTSTTSTTTGNGCLFQQHKCNGTCVDNTPETGCFLSSSCDPCPMPAMNGIALCTGNGTCDLKCDAGYVPNSTKTGCDPIPPPPSCCDDADCPNPFNPCIAGFCQFPFGAVCMPAGCDAYCQCMAGGMPGSTGTCDTSTPVPECACAPPP